MRICSPQLGISPKSILGGEIYDREILSGLALKGHQIDVILPYRKKAPKLKNLHIIYTIFPFVFPPHLFNLYVLPYLFSAYQKKSFDILRIHSPTFLGLAGMLFKIMVPKVPVVGIYHWLGEGGILSKYLDPYLLRFFDAIVCDSHFVRKQIIKLYPFTKNKIYTIHNGVDSVLHKTSKSKLLLKTYGIQSDKFVLLFMGLFIKRKNPIFLIELVKDFVKLDKSCILLLCGKGELEDEIKSKIREYNLQNYIYIVPPVFGSDKNKLLNSADIFVHPAKKEGFSLSVIEAMAVGLPVIITDDFSAHEAVRDGITGYCCKNKSEWIRNIRKLMNSQLLRKKMSRAAILDVKRRFTWKIAVQKHISLYNKLVKKNTQCEA